jgi:mannosyltransferase
VRVTRPDVETALLCVAAGAMAVVLGAISLGRRSLWMDEAIDVNLTGLQWNDYLEIAFQREGSQALYLLFLKPWLAVTSKEEWVARLPSVAFAGLAAALLVALGIRLFQSRFAGIAAGLLLATNAFSVAWSQQVRQYALAMLLAVVVTYLFVQAFESDDVRWWLVYGVVAGVSVYAHFFVALVLASHVPALCISPRVVALWKVAVGACLGLAIALPALDFSLNHDTGQVAWIPTLEFEYVRDVVHEVSGDSWFLFIFGALALVLLLAHAVGRRTDAWRYVLVASWLVVPVALAIAISYFKPMLVDRYLIVSVPALALAVAYAISRLGRLAGTVMLIILVVVALTHVRDWYGSPVEQDWRGAVNQVERDKLPDEQLLVYPGWLADPAIYYAGAAVDTSEVLATDRAWAITLTERAQEIEQWAADGGYEIADRTDFGNIGVWRLQRPNAG